MANISQRMPDRVIIPLMNEGLVCRKCGAADSGVTDSRPTLGGIRRRRECSVCGDRFSTLEIPAVEVAGQRLATMREFEIRQQMFARFQSAMDEVLRRFTTTAADDIPA